MKINGTIYDYMGISIKIEGILFNDLESINYTASKEIEVSTNMQGRINGWGRKEYTASGNISLSFSDYNQLKRLISQDGASPFYNNKSYIIEVNYGNNDQGLITDIFDVVFTSEDSSNTKGDTKKNVSLNFQIVSPDGIKTIYEDGTTTFGLADLRKGI